MKSAVCARSSSSIKPFKSRPTCCQVPTNRVLTQLQQSRAASSQAYEPQGASALGQLPLCLYGQRFPNDQTESPKQSLLRHSISASPAILMPRHLQICLPSTSSSSGRCQFQQTSTTSWSSSSRTPNIDNHKDSPHQSRPTILPFQEWATLQPC